MVSFWLSNTLFSVDRWVQIMIAWIDRMNVHWSTLFLWSIATLCKYLSIPVTSDKQVYQAECKIRPFRCPCLFPNWQNQNTYNGRSRRCKCLSRSRGHCCSGSELNLRRGTSPLILYIRHNWTYGWNRVFRSCTQFVSQIRRVSESLFSSSLSISFSLLFCISSSSCVSLVPFVFLNVCLLYQNQSPLYSAR